MKQPSTWDLVWELIGALWTLALYGFIVYAIYRQEWTEGTFWLAFLILDKVNSLKGDE